MSADVRRALEDPARLEALAATGLFGTGAEEALDRLTRLAARVLDVQTAFIALVGEDRQVIKSSVGLPEASTFPREMPLSHSFCQHAVVGRERMVIGDTAADPRVAENPAREAYGIAAYLAIPLVTSDGHALGSLCAVDRETREWTKEQVDLLADLARSAITEIELRIESYRLREAEAELRRSETLFRGIVENVEDVITLLDADGTIRYESPSLERALGWPPEDLVGSSALEHVHPEDRDRIAGELGAALEAEGKVRIAEFRFRHRDGTWRRLEGVARAFAEDAVLDGIVIVSRDVTELRELEQRLRLLAAAVEQATEGVMVTDAELDPPGPEIVYVNPAVTELTGYVREELLGRTPRILQGPDTDRDVLDRLREDLEARRPFEGETVNYRKDGGEYVVNWRVAPVTDADGEVTHFVAVQRDVTDERRYRERLEEEVRRRTGELRVARREVLERLARAAEYRDDETGEHTQRVGRLVAALARRLELSRERVRLLELTAPLHDLGKIGIPDAVLLKPARLTEAEFELMKRHTTIGGDLLAGGASELARTAETIARTHHERWDGTGYPEGLAGEEIPLAGRLVGVADAFDAMAHARPYKPAYPLPKVVGELEDGAGTQFDPGVVEALLALEEDLEAFLAGG